MIRKTHGIKLVIMLNGTVLEQSFSNYGSRLATLCGVAQWNFLAAKQIGLKNQI